MSQVQVPIYTYARRFCTVGHLLMSVRKNNFIVYQVSEGYYSQIYQRKLTNPER